MKQDSPLASTSDADFIRLFETIGPHKLSRHLEIDVRNVYERRRRLEQKHGRQIKSPDSVSGRTTRHADDHAAVIHHKVRDGIVLIGSDAHIWPSAMTTAMRAFVKFCKDLAPAIVILNGDVLDFPQVSRHPPIGHLDLPNIGPRHHCVVITQTQLVSSSRSGL